MKKFLIKLLYSKYFILLVVALIGLSSNYFLGDNNPIEEITEEIIKKETELDVDFTDVRPYIIW